MTAPPALRPASGVRVAWALVRLATAAALAVAIVAQLIHTISVAWRDEQHVPTVITNHLSYFTVISTTAGAVVLILGGFWLLSRGRRTQWEPRWLTISFLCVGAAVVITGIVFNVLLRNDGVPDPDTLVWASEIKHVVAPLVFAAEFVLRVARPAMPWSYLGIVLIFPIGWATYTMIRGEFITNPLTGQPWWYPYPFLTPYRVAGGYLGVFGYIIGIAAIFVIVAALAIAWSRARRKHQDTPVESIERTLDSM